MTTSAEKIVNRYIFPFVTSPKYSFNQTTTFFSDVLCASRSRPLRVSLIA